MSYFTAQFFRVRKQMGVSGSLSQIETRLNDVTDRLEAQTEKLVSISNARLVQFFDGCLDAVRDAKEDLADKSRPLKRGGTIDIAQFSLVRGNPFYAARRSAEMLVGYASYAATADEFELLGERFTRSSYQIEELAGAVGTFIGRLNHHNVDWRTTHSQSLVEAIKSALDRFEREILVHSRYATAPYKGGQDLRAALQRHVTNLSELAKG